MKFEKPVRDLIQLRYSCRTYAEKRIGRRHERLLLDCLSSGAATPFGSSMRFICAAATDEDRDALRDLGTYGFVKNAAAFIIGAVEDTGKGLEDFGYRVQEAVLLATSLGLGTCWLGGSFTRSSFSARVGLKDGESLPAVVSVGYPAEKPRLVDSLIRYGAGSRHRKPWHELYFLGRFGVPLDRDDAGRYADVLDMVRLAPSASNHQPWRIVKAPGKSLFHLFLQRKKGYYKKTRGLFGMLDLQRVDMGIAMCHFDYSAREEGLAGRWETSDPAVSPVPPEWEYIASWVGK